MSNHRDSGPRNRNRDRRNRIDPIWRAPTLFIIVAGIVALTAGAFSGKFQETIPITLVSDRAGLVMEQGAKVKLRGVQVGQVGRIGTDVKAAQLQLEDAPGPVHVSAEQPRGRDQIDDRVRVEVRRSDRAGTPQPNTAEALARCCTPAT